MKTVTEVRPQIKNPKRVSVFLDGEYFCGIDSITAHLYRIKTGRQIDENELKEIVFQSETQSAFNLSLNMLSKSVKTEKSVRDKLKTYGYSDEVINAATEKLKGYSFICDEDYSKRYVSSYSAKKGKRLLKAELKMKGVTEDIAEKAVSGIENEESTALTLAEKYVRNKEKDLKTMQKCYKYLISKGFSYEDSSYAAKKATETEEDTD